MKNRISITLLILLCMVGLVSAQKDIENTMLWEVTHKKQKSPSYLFGTFHLLCKNDFELKEKVTKALGQSNNFVMELNYSDPSVLEEMSAILSAEKSWLNDLTDEEKKYVSDKLQPFGYKLADLQKVSPFVVYSMLTQKFFDCSPTEMKMIDLELMQMAVKQNKQIMAFETLEEQVKIFDIMFQKKDFMKTIEDFETSKALLSKLAMYYKEENLKAINELMNNDQMTKEQHEIIIDSRNEKWTKKMPEIMNKQSTFFAVGAGHLGGEKGLINLLRSEGYTVRPVE